MEKNTDDENKKAILEYLLEQDMLKGNAEGIAKAAISQGYSSLSDKQKYVLSSYFEPTCEGCKFHECEASVSDEDFVFSIENKYDLEAICCRHCAEMRFDQIRTWENMKDD